MGLFSRLKQASPVTPPSNSKKQSGQHYETLAMQHLQRQGLTLVTRNFRAKCGEIDLIMRDNATIVFIEVKYRQHAKYGHAAEAVTAKKARRVIRTAQLWLMKNNLSLHSTDIRFDVVALHQQGQQLEWYKSALTDTY
ncbi:YraN family protein [Vibrio astriarenae]|uniref:YraN family protein n=1 Tax=Vibrio astriarenae TaxID=1481923 RepID=UPI0037362E2E